MKFLLIFCSFNLGVCYAQIPTALVQAGGNCLLFRSGVFSAANSAAYLPLNKESFGISLSNKFGLSALSRLDVAAQLASGGNHLGFSYGLIPFKRSLEHQVSLAFAASLMENLHAGISIAYKGGKAGREEAKRHFGGTVAGIYEVNPMLTVGAQFELSNTGEKESALHLRSGFCYRISDRIIGTAEILVGRDRVLDWRVACSIPAGKHELTMGYFPAGSTLCIGICINSALDLSFSTQYHPILGISPSLSLVKADE